MRRSRSTLVIWLVASALLVALVGTGDAARPGRAPPPRLLAAGVQGLAPTGSAAAAACAPVWTTVASPDGSPSVNLLSSLSVVSDTDVWAVGHDLGTTNAYRTLTLHWEGSAWKVVPSANVGAGDNVLAGVAASSSNDVWAVGSSTTSTGLQQTLIEHWDGSAWSVISSPNAGSGNNALWSVATASGADVWAVGTTTTDVGASQTLIEHWDGILWTIAVSPNPSPGGSVLNGVAAQPADAWAVGFSSSDTASALQTQVQRWNGTAWSVIRSSNTGTGVNNFLVDVTSLSATDAWAVGYSDGATQSLALVEHWDGRKWGIVANPAGATQNARLLAVAPVSAGDVWFVGSSGYSRDSLIEHWDGTALSVAPVPASSTVYGIAALPDGRVWAAGFKGPHTFVEQLCEISVADAGFSPTSSTASLGGVVAWNLPAVNAQNHTVTDASGMGLFDSGLRAPGSSYTFAFTGAGTYSVTDSVSSQSATIAVPLTATPQRGGVLTTFTITWGSTPPAIGFVFDVQIKRPGSSSFVDWMTSQTAASAKFVPDAGSGTYLFRARLRNVSSGKASGYSPSASIVVT